MDRSLIIFPIHELVTSNLRSVHTAMSANFDLDTIGEYAFAAWTDYNTTSRRYWSFNDFDPMDVIVESIYREIDHRRSVGLVHDVHMPWYESIIPEVAHLSLCLFLTITDYIGKYQYDDRLSFNFVTANECDFIISY